MELLLLLAIAYAGARGVEAITGTGDRRHSSTAAETTVKKIAKSGDGSSKPPGTKPGPTDPGGTFSKAAPRSAALGGRAAAPVAVVVETGSTVWKAIGEGYRDALPGRREARRRKMTDRATERGRKKKAAEDKEKAEEALAKAGPPPPHPPPPATPPPPAAPPTAGSPPAGTGTAGPTASTGGRAPTSTGARPPAPTGRPSGTAPASVPGPRPSATVPPGPPSTASAPGTTPPGPAAGAAPATSAEPGRRHLAVVPTAPEIGDPMSSLSSLIPEVRTLTGLMNGFTLLDAMFTLRMEEGDAIAADDRSLANQLDQLEAQLADLEVDDKTRAEIDKLRDDIHNQSTAATEYASRSKDAADLAQATKASAYMAHGGIAEAVHSSPIERIALAGHYDR